MSFAAVKAGRSRDELAEYPAAYRKSWVYKDLKRVRNVKPLWNKLGLHMGLALGGLHPSGADVVAQLREGVEAGVARVARGCNQVRP